MKAATTYIAVLLTFVMPDSLYSESCAFIEPDEDVTLAKQLEYAKHGLPYALPLSDFTAPITISDQSAISLRRLFLFDLVATSRFGISPKKHVHLEPYPNQATIEVIISLRDNHVFAPPTKFSIMIEKLFQDNHIDIPPCFNKATPVLFRADNIPLSESEGFGSHVFDIKTFK